MSPEDLRDRIPSGEIIFSTSRSGGPGGQNVNKVNSKVELRFNVNRSFSFSDKEKKRILIVLKKRINSEGELLITSQSERTQLMNRKKAEYKFFILLAKALTKKAERKPSSPTIASKTKRLEQKKKRSKIKRLRKDSGKSEEDF
jgi:ribosome-associated protein